MRNLTGVLALLAALAAAGVVAGAGAVWAEEGAGARFTDPERVAAYFDNQPDRAVKALERILTPEQATALEAALFPPPTDAERRLALERAREELLRGGLDAKDELIGALDARLAGALR